MLRGHYGDTIKENVTITSTEKQPFKITEITSNIEDKIDYKLRTIREGQEYCLEIKTRSGIKEFFKGKVLLKTDNQKKPELDIYVQGKVKKEVKVAPVYLYFGIIDAGKKVIDPQSLQRTALVSSIRGDDLSIKQIEISSNWIATEIGTIKKGKEYSIVIKLDKDKLPKGEFREKVTIHAAYAKRSETARIIIEGKVK